MRGWLGQTPLRATGARDYCINAVVISPAHDARDVKGGYYISYGSVPRSSRYSALGDVVGEAGAPRRGRGVRSHGADEAMGYEGHGGVY